MNDIAHNTTFLIQAANIGDAVEVQWLRPVSDPKFDDSYALRTAAEKGHFDVSDPYAALKSLHEKTDLDPQIYSYLQQKINMQRQHKALTLATESGKQFLRIRKI